MNETQHIITPIPLAAPKFFNYCYVILDTYLINESLKKEMFILITVGWKIFSGSAVLVENWLKQTYSLTW